MSVGVILSAPLKPSVVIQESLCVLTGLGSDYASHKPRSACLICHQVEAALFMRVLLLYRHVLFFFLFVHVTETLISSSDLCICV